ncbi:hypothetical protein [Bradyrhizobium sp.]|uniref:hypothetical protein n=1 Tax=Bradyrhizobium sp. TaxID=376 RepID=UPI00345DAF57
MSGQFFPLGRHQREAEPRAAFQTRFGVDLPAMRPTMVREIDKPTPIPCAFIVANGWNSF